MNTTITTRTKADAFDTSAFAHFTNGERSGNVRVEADADGVWIYVETDGDFNGWDYETTAIHAKHFTWDQFNAVDPDMWR